MVGENDVIEGGCLCGAIRYRATGQSIFTVQCFCRDCQRHSGTGHATVTAFFSNKVEVTGKPSVYSNIGDLGTEVRRNFCGTCGSRLFTFWQDRCHIQVGTMDNPNVVTPSIAMFMKDRAEWDHIDPEITQYQGMRDGALEHQGGGE